MLTKYYRLNAVAGVHIEISKDCEPVFSACLLTINGNDLQIQKKITVVKDINELKKILPDNTSIGLTISGKGILTKKIDHRPDQRVDFSEILPNANQADFYIQEFYSGQNVFVSVIRMQEAEQWIARLKAIKCNVVALSLGPFVVDQALAQLNVYGTELIFNGHKVHFNDQKEWINIGYIKGAGSQFPLKIENEKVAEELLIPYASAFQLALYPNSELVTADTLPLKQKLNALVETRKLKVKGAIILVGVFILLLINLFLYSYFNSSNAVLATQVGQSEKDAGESQLFADSIKLKKALLDTLGWEAKIRKSILLDQLAKVSPAEVKWQQVSVDPVKNDVNGQNILKFATRQISVTGNCNRIIPVNEWIARIREAYWVKDVQLRSYTFNNEQNTGVYMLTVAY